MSDTPDIEITRLPYLGDMLATSIPPAPQTAPPVPKHERGPVRDNAHLLSAVTGDRPPLHIVEENEVPAPVTPLEPEPTPADETRARRRRDGIRATGHLQVDWKLVAVLSQDLQISEGEAGRTRDSFDVAIASADAETDEERHTEREITRIIDRHVTQMVAARGPDHAWGDITRAHYAQAMFDLAHRYGRLQQYLREEDVEDVSIVGSGNVVVTKTSGLHERRPPIADSDQDLEALVAEIAAYRGRSFARPSGHIDLDIGGARLSATGIGITSVTNVTVRKHNMVDVTLQTMVENGTISTEIATFLSAASRANMSVMVAGYPGAGKTTFLRALMAALRPEEKIVTIETERELYLNKMPARHWQVQDLQYVPAQVASADSVAGFTLQQCLDIALRASAKRIVFAEIRGAEGPVALKAMQAGKGSMSTIHARSADDAIHRFADVLMSELGLSSDVVPLRQIGRSIDLMIYIDFLEAEDGTHRRVVTEVAEVVLNDQHQPMAAKLFEYRPETDSWVRPEKPSEKIQPRLLRVGYDWTKEMS